MIRVLNQISQNRKFERNKEEEVEVLCCGHSESSSRRKKYIYHEHDLGLQLILRFNLNKRNLELSVEHSDCVIEQPTRGLLEWNYLLEN